MLDEWKKVKDSFKRPKVHVYFGFWSLPKFIIRLGKYIAKDGFDKHPFLTKIYMSIASDPTLPVWRKGNTIRLFKKYQVYNREYEYIWKEDFKKKLDKYHLGWLKCKYELPIWLSCYIFKHDVIWKWKYDNICYEFPPQFTIVLFNISLSLHWHSPSGDVLDDDYYWTSILNKNYNAEGLNN